MRRVGFEMNVLIVASEAVPFAKTGGLADVIGSLPKALQKEGINVRVILPKYGTIPDQYKDKIQHITAINVEVGWRNQYCGIEEMIVDGIHFYFIDNQYYFHREKLYDFHDEAERFAFFSLAALESIPYLDFDPDIIHCHDWQTALISVFLKDRYLQNPQYEKIKTILTIHNLKFQGVFPNSILSDLLTLGEEYFTPTTLEFFGDVNYLKGGIFYSDVVTTVSKTYAEEIKYSYFGENLEGVLRNKDNILGIVNGIDYDTYDPMKDDQIFFNYRTSLIKKNKNKEALQEFLGLPVNKDIPMIGIISRLTSQKGLDLIEGILEELVLENIQLVVLGTGEYKYEELFRLAARKYPNQIVAHITFDEGTARKIYAGSDMFLMPSKFEPCGLGQLIALRYGSIPIVRETGGLKDTVQPFNQDTGLGNGFTFANYNAHDMLYAIRNAIGVYRDKDLWCQVTQNAIRSDYSWKAAAKEYVNLYMEMV